MTERKPYPSDLTDARWALIEPVLTAWKAAHPSVSGHEGNYELREIVNAIRYQGRTGVQWDYLPHDLPPKSATYYYFSKWRDDGTDKTIHDLLRWHLREKKKRLSDPSLVVLDTQSIHVAAGVPASTTGKDAAKRVPGRKRGLAVDVLGLVIAVVMLAASAHDNTAGIALHRRRHREEDPGLCYLEEPHRGEGMVDHLRGWYRGKKLIAFTVEPYHEVDADAFRAAAPALAEDDLVMSICSCCAVHYPGQTLAVIVTRKEDGQPVHLITHL